MQGTRGSKSSKKIASEGFIRFITANINLLERYLGGGRHMEVSVCDGHLVFWKASSSKHSQIYKPILCLVDISPLYRPSKTSYGIARRYRFSIYWKMQPCCYWIDYIGQGSGYRPSCERTTDITCILDTHQPCEDQIPFFIAQCILPFRIAFCSYSQRG